MSRLLAIFILLFVTSVNTASDAEPLFTLQWGDTDLAGLEINDVNDDLDLDEFIQVKSSASILQSCAPAANYRSVQITLPVFLLTHLSRAPPVV